MKKEIASKNLIKALSQLNLTEKEILTYLTLLERGSSTIQEISRHTGINRVTIYAAIDDLKSKGLAAESRKGKKKLFVAEDPESLTNIVNQKKERLKKEERALNNLILPALKAININQRNKPQIKFFEGSDGIAKIFDEYILKAKEAINCGSYDAAIKISSMEREMEYIQEIKKRKIFFRMILEDTPLNRKLAKAGRGALHVKFLPPETKISADIVIFSSITALISYEKKTATLIEDGSISQAIKMYLNFMWDRL